jgi:hypothetical protein
MVVLIIRAKPLAADCAFHVLQDNERLRQQRPHARRCGRRAVVLDVVAKLDDLVQAGEVGVDIELSSSKTPWIDVTAFFNKVSIQFSDPYLHRVRVASPLALITL